MLRRVGVGLNQLAHLTDSELTVVAAPGQRPQPDVGAPSPRQPIVDPGPVAGETETLRLHATDVSSVRVELIRGGQPSKGTEPIAPFPEAIPLALPLVQNLRRRVEPRLDDLRRGADWERAHDPAEALRRVRIATRRLRCFLHLFEPIIGDVRARPLRKQLRRTARGIGPLRDWDALLALLHTEHANAEPLGKAALESAMAWVGARREPEVEQARKAIAKGDLCGLADAIDVELDRVCGRIMRLDDRLESEVIAWMERILKRNLEGAPIGEEPTETMLHDLRLRAKKVRYSAEMLAPANEHLGRARKHAKKVQRVLGKHRDTTRLGRVFEQVSDDLLRRSMTTLAAESKRMSSDFIVRTPALESSHIARFLELRVGSPAPPSLDERGGGSKTGITKMPEAW